MVVAAAAHAPALIVQETKQVIQDVAKVATEVTKIVADVSAKMVSAVDTAITAVSEFAQTAAPYLKAALDFAAEVTGVNDAIACATKGDVEACLWTIATVGSMFVPGATAGVRGAKAARAGMKMEHAAKTAFVSEKGATTAGKGTKLAEKAEDLAGATCQRKSPNSFTPETSVLMADGMTKPIKDVKVGDKVLATDPTTGKTEARAVDDVIIGNGEKHLVKLTVDTDGGKGDATGTITATEGHPFWLEDQKTWTDAGKVKPGAMLRTSTGTWVKVTATRAWTAVQQVFNLSVSGIHTFYVQAGTAPTLVHNNGQDACPALAGALAEADKATGFSPSKLRPAVAEAIELPNGRVISRASTRGDATPDLHPDVKRVLDSIPEEARGKGHGKCGLPSCLSEALEEGIDPTGSTAAAVTVRSNSTHPKHGMPVGPCPSCQVLTRHYGLDFATGG